MIRCSTSVRAAASAPAAFDVIGTGVYDNHPRWEREVRQIRPLTPGPVRVGSEAVMVRKDGLRERETVYRVTELEPGRRIAFDHPADGMHFQLAFTVEGIDDDTCDIQVDVAAQPHGLARIFTPMMRLGFPRRTRRISRQMVQVIEELAATPSNNQVPAV